MSLTVLLELLSKKMISASVDVWQLQKWHNWMTWTEKRESVCSQHIYWVCVLRESFKPNCKQKLTLATKCWCSQSFVSMLSLSKLSAAQSLYLIACSYHHGHIMHKLTATVLQSPVITVCCSPHTHTHRLTHTHTLLLPSNHLLWLHSEVPWELHTHTHAAVLTSIPGRAEPF